MCNQMVFNFEPWLFITQKDTWRAFCLNIWMQQSGTNFVQLQQTFLQQQHGFMVEWVDLLKGTILNLLKWGE